MKKVLLHICCAGCAGVSISRLQEEGFSVRGIFYNPNIQPEAEYRRREKDLEKVSKKFSIEILQSEYYPEEWLEKVKGYESQPEGAKRCQICFQFRLKKVYQRSLKEGCGFFATTLTISPHKNSKVINQIGNNIEPERFLVRDFKKKDGFKESVKMSKELDLYRQNYCGCIFSRRS